MMTKATPSRAQGHTVFKQRLSGVPGRFKSLGWALAVALPLFAACGAAPPRWSVTDVGAVGNGLTLDTEAIQSAIDTAVAQGGGTVVFPPGNYLSSLLRIQGDHVTLLFEEGAILQATTDLAAYPENQRRLLHVVDARDVHLRGPGLIELNGNAFTRDRRLNWRVIYFENCRQVSVSDLTIRRSPNWTLTFKGCDGVTVRNVTIDKGTLINSDGIGLLSSRNVHIADCFVNTSDDAIVIKSRDPQRAAGSANILIENCTVASSSNAIKIGTETVSDFENITIRNIRVIKPTDGRRERPLSAIALITDDGGNIENIRIENIHAEEVYAGIFLRVQRRLRGDRDRPGRIRNVVIDGLTVERQYTTSSIMGIPDYAGRPARVGPGITLRNISITSVEEAPPDAATHYPGERPRNYPDGIHFAPYPSHGIYIRHAQGITLGPNVRFHTRTGDIRPAVKIEDTAEVMVLPGTEEPPGETLAGAWPHDGREYPFRVTPGKGMDPAVPQAAAVYLRHLPRPRLGTDDDADLRADLLEQGLLLVELDCRGISPETPAMERTLFAFHRALPRLVDSLSQGRWTVDTHRVHTVPEGYRLRRNIPYWNIARHGVHGSLERVLEVYNTTVAERFGISPVETIEDMRGPEGQPFDYNLYLDVVYPSGEGVEPVPTIAHFATFWPMESSLRHGERRLLPIGWLTSGYAMVHVDHVYNPPARSRYYGHFNPGFSLDIWNGVAAGSAAIRYLRTHAATFNLNGQIGALGHSKSSYTVARLADPRHAGLEEHQRFAAFPPGRPEPPPWPGPESDIQVAYASMGMGTRRIQYFNERTVPLVLAVGRLDHFDHWQAFPELIAHGEALDLNHFVLWMEELGHTFPAGLDQATGEKRILLLRRFFDQHLHPSGDTSLRILGIIPADGAENVALDGASPLLFVPPEELPGNLHGVSPESPITVRFARPINLAALPPEAFRVIREPDGEPVPGEWRPTLQNTRFQFFPREELAPDTVYSVGVKEGIQDGAGNRLASPHHQRFRTRLALP